MIFMQKQKYTSMGQDKPETSSTYGQFIYDNGDKNIQTEKRQFLQ